MHNVLNNREIISPLHQPGNYNLHRPSDTKLHTFQVFSLHLEETRHDHATLLRCNLPGCIDLLQHLGGD